MPNARFSATAEVAASRSAKRIAARFMARESINCAPKEQRMGLLDGKTGIIFGVANKRSIAWAIAQALSAEGMRLAFTYQGERLKENVEELASTLSDALLLPCDVTIDGEISAVFQEVDAKFGRLDSLIHSVAFAPREDLEDEFVKT